MQAVLIKVIYRILCALANGDPETIRRTAGACKGDMEKSLGCGKS